MSEALQLQPQKVCNETVNLTNGPKPPPIKHFARKDQSPPRFKPGLELSPPDHKADKAFQNWIKLATPFKMEEEVGKKRIFGPILSSLTDGPSKSSTVFQSSIEPVFAKSAPPPSPQTSLLERHCRSLDSAKPNSLLQTLSSAGLSKGSIRKRQMAKYRLDSWVNALEENKRKLFIPKKQTFKSAVTGTMDNWSIEFLIENGKPSDAENVWKTFSGARPVILLVKLVCRKIVCFENLLKDASPILTSLNTPMNGQSSSDDEPFSPVDERSFGSTEEDNSESIKKFFKQECGKFVAGLKKDELAFSGTFELLEAGYELVITKGIDCRKNPKMTNLSQLSWFLVNFQKQVQTLCETVEKSVIAHRDFTARIGGLHREVNEIEKEFEGNPINTVTFISLFNGEKTSILTNEEINFEEVTNLWKNYKGLFWACLDDRRIFLDKLLAVSELQADNTNDNQKDGDQADDMVGISKKKDAT
jgi:hypothetical protein